MNIHEVFISMTTRPDLIHVFVKVLREALKKTITAKMLRRGVKNASFKAFLLVDNLKTLL